MPPAENFPVAQFEHTVDTVAIVVVDSVPDAHLVQVAAPKAFAYVPPRQLEQADAPAAEYVPRAQSTQVVMLTAGDAVEYAPAGHGVHAVASLSPSAAEYAPCGHFEQDPDALRPVLLEKKPAGHAVQLIMPMLEVYMPALQSEQALAPVSEAKVPTPQFAHSDSAVAPDDP
jgi:hypothetical protein